MKNDSKKGLVSFLLFVFILTLIRYHACGQSELDLVKYVNPFIGVLDNNISNCTVGPQIPFGSVNPGPQTPEGGHDGYSFYESVRGFGQVHVSGTGWGRYGQFLVSPQIGLEVSETGHDSPKSGEIAKAYYYSVNLDRYGIKTELAPTHHAVIYRFMFPKSRDAHLLIDVSHSLTRDIAYFVKGQVHAGKVEITKNGGVVGDKITGSGTYSGGFGQGEYTIYFCAKFSKDSNTHGVWKNRDILDENQTSITEQNDRIGAFLGFITEEQEPVLMKIGISFKSTEQAERWLDMEIPGWDFDAVKENARKVWNKELGKIVVEGGSEKDKTLFYSALYRTMMMPRNRTNDIGGWPENTPLWDDYYTGWDTWRTLFPLMTLINPQVVSDNINSFIARFRKNRIVKDAFIAGQDVYNEQGGNDVDNIIADAFVKNIDGVNWQEAYELLKFNADSQRLGKQKSYHPAKLDTIMSGYKKRGWIPAGKMSCSVSLEYSYNDFCIAEVAQGLGKNLDYQKYYARNKKWTNLWNPEMESFGFKGFICPKSYDDTWVEIDPCYRWFSWDDYFYEGSSWTYSYFVPHDFSKLIDLCGGKKIFAERLEYGLANGLIDYSNEPAFLSIQSFHHAGCPDRTSYWIKKMMNEKYTEKGYPGNEDSGAMSSWYVFASLGFFPNAGQAFYYLNGPSFKKVTVLLGNGEKLQIEAKNLTAENRYIQSCTMNGRPLNSSIISHNQLLEGGILEFSMGPEPVK